MSSVFFPSMVHHTSVRESFRNVKKTSQDRTRSSPGKKGQQWSRAKQDQHHSDCWASRWHYQLELCLHFRRQLRAAHAFRHLTVENPGHIDLWQTNRKNYPAFLNTSETSWLHQGIPQWEVLHANQFLENLAVLIIPPAQGTVTLKRSILVLKHLFRHFTSPQDQAWEPEYSCDQLIHDCLRESAGEVWSSQPRSSALKRRLYC